MDKIKEKNGEKNLLKKNTKLIMLLLCKDEVDIIEPWLLFHKAMGVDGFIVTDNNSTDGTREILQKYKDKGDILEIIDDAGTVHLQAQRCDRMIKLAIEKYKADWIISSDADEFWYAQSLNLKKDILDNEACNTQYVCLHNFIPYEKIGNFLDGTYWDNRIIQDFEQQKYNFSVGYKNNYVYKIIFKAKDYIRIVDGNHDAQMKNKCAAKISNIKIYHYFIRNFQHFNHKVKKGGEALKDHPVKTIGSYWRVWYQDYYLQNKMQELWDKIYLFDRFNDFCEMGVIVKDTSIKDFMQEIVLNEKSISLQKHK